MIVPVPLNAYAKIGRADLTSERACRTPRRRHRKRAGRLFVQGFVNASTRGRPDLYRSDVDQPTGGTASLIAQALAAADCDPDAYAESVRELHRRADDASYQAVRGLCLDTDPVRRRLGADVLARFGHALDSHPQGRPHWESTVALLLHRLAVEQDPAVLVSLTHALGQLSQPRRVDPDACLHRHPDPGIRAWLAEALGAFADPIALDVLVEQSTDPAPGISGRATHGLARRMPLDTPVLRDALAARLDDPVGETRVEAILGLARRGDARAVVPLLQERDALWSPAAREAMDEAALMLVARTGDARLRSEVERQVTDWRARHPAAPMPEPLQVAVERFATA